MTCVSLPESGLPVRDASCPARTCGTEREVRILHGSPPWPQPGRVLWPGRRGPSGEPGPRQRVHLPRRQMDHKPQDLAGRNPDLCHVLTFIFWNVNLPSGNLLNFPGLSVEGCRLRHPAGTAVLRPVYQPVLLWPQWGRTPWFSCGVKRQSGPTQVLSILCVCKEWL